MSQSDILLERCVSTFSGQFLVITNKSIGLALVKICLSLFVKGLILSLVYCIFLSLFEVFFAPTVSY